jgi:hypothetical protein
VEYEDWSLFMKTVTFDNSKESKKAILQLFNKSVDKLGYIIEIKSGERVVSPRNEEIHIDDFAGIRPGSEIFLTNDLPSLMEQAEYLKK